MDKNVKNGQNDEMDEATASLSSRRVLGAAARGLVCLNRHICWYSIGGSSRDPRLSLTISTPSSRSEESSQRGRFSAV